jgi:hypothetical protein
MLRPVRRRLAALALVVLVPVVGACSYQTDQVYQAGVGVNNRSGTVDVLGAVVVSSSDGTGTFVASLVNKSDTDSDTIVSVTGDGLQAHLTAPVQVQPQSLVNLADTGDVGVTGPGVKSGAFVRLTLVFQSGQKTTVNAPVVPMTEEYADITPAAPSGSPTP